MFEALLTTKLACPPARPTAIPRRRLFARLNDSLTHQLTLISAPPGFGKTTLVSQWLASQSYELSVKSEELNQPGSTLNSVRAQYIVPLPLNCGVAWLSLDQDDDDPIRFLAYLVAALQRAQAGIGAGARATLNAPQPLIQATLTALINEIEAAARPLVLVLDDYHLIESHAVHNALAYLLDHQPPNLHLVIATRADPPLPLALLRGRGQLLELRQRDLCFTPDEAAQFLNQATRLELAAEDVCALVAQTEGWIAGLQLAATSMQAHGDAGRFMREFKGSNRYVLDYLVEEVLQRQPEAVQTFLLQTAILDRLSGPLCDAVTGQPDGQATLERLERANLFLVPLDDERRWYRYHRLFADLLQKRLGESSTDLLPCLHGRASVWYEQHGLPAAAIHHALAARDAERAGGLIERAAEATLMRGETATLLKWLHALPGEQIAARPRLSVYHAWVLLLSGAPLELVEARLEQAEQHSAQALPLHAFVASYRGDPDRAVELARRALEQLPEHDTFLRDLTTLTLVVAYHIGNDVAASQQMFEQATRAGTRAGHLMLAVQAPCYRAKLCWRGGQLRQARALYRQALDLARDEHGERLPMAGQALLGLGEIARECDELDTAARYAAEGIALIEGWAPVGAVNGYITLARIAHVQGDSDGVDDAIGKMRELAARFDVTDLDDRLVELTEAQLRIARGDLDPARRWAGRYGLNEGVQPAKLEAGDNLMARRIRKYEYPVVARLWLAEGRPAAALALLETALPHVERLKRMALAIEYSMLIALAAQALGQAGRAEARLTHALALAEPEGFVRLFIDEGAPVRALLERLQARRGGSRPYLRSLLAAFGAAPAPQPAPQPLIEPLSERELEVLRLIATGMSNEAIARTLVLSLPTIKWHTSNIYGKLAVKNRTEAVAKARALDLLSAA